MMVQIKIYCLLISVIFVISSCSNADESVRLKQNINRNWQFTFSSETDNFPEETSDSVNWKQVGLPHSFSIPYFRSESFYEGYGWYQKNLVIEKEWLDKNISLEFDGVFQVAEIFLNGKRIWLSN